MFGGGVLNVVAVASQAETWLLDGLVTPYRVRGGSMAGALLGVHRDVVCEDCGYRFACDSDARTPPVRAVCPNCGYAANAVPSLPNVAGDRVLVDRWPSPSTGRGDGKSWPCGPSRTTGCWSNAWSVCRVKQSKFGTAMYTSMERLHAEPSRAAAWPSWCTTRGSFRARAAWPGAVAARAGRQQWPGRPGSLPPRGQCRAPRGRLAGLSSPAATAGDGLCGYNQSQPRREEDVHAVADLLLSLRRRLYLRRTRCVGRSPWRRKPRFEARLRFVEGRLAQWTVVRATRRAGTLIASHCQRAGGGPRRRAGCPRRAACRGVVGGSTVLVGARRSNAGCDSISASGGPAPPTCPAAIGADGIDVTVRNLRLYRDVYYTDRVKRDTPIFADAKIGTVPDTKIGQSPPWRLAVDAGRVGPCSAPGEYYVLGDNSPVSEDSRTWPEPAAVDAKCLIGKPLVAISYVTVSLGGAWHFQVPNPIEIRYIR